MSCVLEHDRLRRGRKTVLQPTRLEFPDGAVVGVIGANGAGKSTLFLALAGLLRRGAGSARVFIRTDGDAVSANRSAGNPVRIAFMPQEPALPPWLAVRDAVALQLGQADEELYRALSLDALLDTRVGRLSGGEVQAVALAATLGRAADVLVLDEPLAHLDFRRRIAAIELLRSRSNGRRLTLISSQNAADLATFCDWYFVLRDGRAAFNGSLADVLGADVAADARLAALERRLLGLIDGSVAVGAG